MLPVAVRLWAGPGGSADALPHRCLDLLHPPAAGSVASSPAVLLATDRIIARPGPSRGPRLH